MGYEVFLSYCEEDIKYVEAIVHHLEGKGVRCWYAPRDISPGEDWPQKIGWALSQVKVMILVYSSHSWNSKQVAREVKIADDHPDLVVVPVKTENVRNEESSNLSYYLANTHWLDAVGKDINVILPYLETIILNILGREASGNLETRPTMDAPLQIESIDVQGEDMHLARSETRLADGEEYNQVIESTVVSPIGDLPFSASKQAIIDASEIANLISQFPEDRQDFLRSLANTGLSSSPTISITEVRGLVGEDDYGKDIQRWLYSACPVKRGIYFNPLVIERVLSSFTKRQQEFLRALVAEGYGGNEVLTASDVESVLKERKRMNWPQWLRTTSEFTHPKRGFYQNPIQVRLKAFFSQIEQEPIAQNEPFLGEQSENLPLEEGDQGVTESPRLAERSKLNSFDEFGKELDPRNELAGFVAIIKLIHDDVLKTFPDVRVSYSKTRISFFNDAFPRRAKSFLTLGVWTPPVRIRIEKERTDEELPQGAVEDWYKKSQWMAFNFHINRSEEYSEKVKEYIRRNYQRAMEGKSL